MRTFRRTSVGDLVENDVSNGGVSRVFCHDGRERNDFFRWIARTMTCVTVRDLEPPVEQPVFAHELRAEGEQVSAVH